MRSATSYERWLKDDPSFRALIASSPDIRLGPPPRLAAERGVSESQRDVRCRMWLAADGDETARIALDEYLGRLRFVHPHLDGDAMRVMGLAPGPVYGRLLTELRNGWLDGEITNEADERRRLEALVRLEAGRATAGDA